MRTFNRLAVIAVALMLFTNAALAQTPSARKQAIPNQSPITQAATTVTGGGTLGRLSKWVSTSSLGDSVIIEDKFGNVGIGTIAPTSKLTIAGMIETTLGGYKFPDGSVQTTAGIPFVTHDASLDGAGTVDSHLGIAVGGVQAIHLASGAVQAIHLASGAVTDEKIGVPLTLTSGVFNQFTQDFGTLNVANTERFGWGLVSKGGAAGFNGGEGGGVLAIGRDNPIIHNSAGVGLRAMGGKNSMANGKAGTAIIAEGGECNDAPNCTGGTAVFAIGGINPSHLGGLAGDFLGSISVTNNVTKGGGSFKIDHPLDPENKYLYHSFVESPDMKNIYDGVATLDANGEAVIEMPEWFEALNRDFRYLLTPIGMPAPTLFIAQKIKGNHFKIAGGTPGMEVSWQVTGIRQDAYANRHRIPVEENKPEAERGYYLHADAFDQPESKSLVKARMNQVMNAPRPAANPQ